MRLKLLPTPKCLERLDDFYILNTHIVLDVALGFETSHAVARLKNEIESALGPTTYYHVHTATDTQNPTPLRLLLDPQRLRPQHYQLDINSELIQIIAGDGAGLLYGVHTLCQLIRTHKTKLPCVHIEDSPSLAVRAVMLDISRDKVPTLTSLQTLIDMLASWKINQVQLYTEHTFAYSAHPDVWANASPLTASDIQTLDAFCRERYVELVPNQNSFGHMERWFAHERYRPMAETNGGITLPWGEVTKYPFTISPVHPDSLPFIDGLYRELLPNFTSQRFNIGCDETVDLGRGKSKEATREKGRGGVWRDFVLSLRKLAAQHGRHIQIWGDMLRRHPELITDIPKDVTILDWGYERERRLSRTTKPLREANLSVIVCPGTSSWTSIAGRTKNALDNILEAVETANTYGCEGVMITDWGDGGHWQHISMSYVPLAWGAALSWDLEANRNIQLTRVLDALVFLDSAGVTAQALYDLGNAYLQVGFRRGNSSMLHWFYVVSLAHVRENWVSKMRQGKHILLQDELTRKHMHKTLDYVTGVMASLSGASMQCGDATQLQQEMTHASQMLQHSARRVLFELDGGDAGVMQDELKKISEDLSKLWLQRNRPGGLSDSLEKLERAFALYC